MDLQAQQSLNNINIYLNKYQDIKEDNERCSLPIITQNIFRDGIAFQKTYNQAQIGPPPDSLPKEEPWNFGPPKFTHYTQISISQLYYQYKNHNINHNDFIPLVIGVRGSNLISITQQANLHYLWYDQNRKVFEFWGSPQYFPIAIQLLYQQINWVLYNTHLS